MKFYIKQKVFSLKDQFNIMNEKGETVYQVAGKMFSFANKMELQNPNGSVVLHTRKQLFRFLPKYFLMTPHDEEIATIERKFGLRPKFSVQVGTETLRVEGSFFAHSFQIYNDASMLASIQKKVISFGDSYEIDIADENHVELYLFVVIILDQIIHEKQHNNN